jgi:probable HAF family extracellular repeat protein
MAKVRSSARFFVSGLLILAADVSSGQYLYTLTEIISPQGGASRASALNDKGWVAGESETPAGNVQAFVWSEEKGFRDLGTLGGVNSRAFDINVHGLVVGESDNSNGVTQAFGWTEDRGMFPLPVTEQTVYSTALAVNQHGHIVGMLEDDTGIRAVMWKDGQMSFLPRLPGHGNVQPLGINGNGDVVGQIQTGDDESFASHAFFFYRATDARNLAEFRLISPQSGSAAVAISDDGVAVGYTMSDSSRVRSFRYTRSDGMVFPDDNGALFSSATDINAAGIMVGSIIPSYLADETAGYWRNGRWFELNEVTDTRGDWWLIQAAAINASSAIAGYGLHGENNRAFLLVPAAGQDADRWPRVSLVARDVTETTQPERSLILTAIVADLSKIRRVLFYENGVVIGSVEEAPYEWGWQGRIDFEGEFYAEVVDDSGRRFRSPRMAVEAVAKHHENEHDIHE